MTSTLAQALQCVVMTLMLRDLVALNHIDECDIKNDISSIIMISDI